MAARTGPQGVLVVSHSHLEVRYCGKTMGFGMNYQNSNSHSGFNCYVILGPNLTFLCLFFSCKKKGIKLLI